jgi:hypothetical protein
MSSQIRVLARFANHADEDPFPRLPVNGVELFRLRFDSLDRGFPGKTPVGAWVSDVCNVLVRACAIWLTDTRNFELVHGMDSSSASRQLARSFVGVERAVILRYTKVVGTFLGAHHGLR